jgi:HK97 family phage prohead protease
MTIEVRALEFALELRDDGDGRTLVGPLLPYGVEARIGPYVTEVFERGAFGGTEPGRVPLTATHPRDGGTLPIGVTVELREETDALHGAWHVSDTALGNEVLALAHDGVPLGLSVGFEPQPGGSQWNATRTRVVRTRARMDHVAVVRSAAYPGARVEAVRAAVVPPPGAPLLTRIAWMRRQLL